MYAKLAFLRRHGFFVAPRRNITNVAWCHCRVGWNAGYAGGQLSIAGTNPQVNVTDVQLSKLHIRSGEDSTVRLLRVTGDLELATNSFFGFARVMATDCIYPSGAPTVQNLGGASVHVGIGDASCDETCAEAGALCDGDTLAGIDSADKLRQLLAGTHARYLLDVMHIRLMNMCRDPTDDLKNVEAGR